MDIKELPLEATQRQELYLCFTGLDMDLTLKLPLDYVSQKRPLTPITSKAHEIVH